MRTLFLDTFIDYPALKNGYQSLINEADSGNANLNSLFNELELIRTNIIKDKYPVKYNPITIHSDDVFSFKLNTNHLISNCPFNLLVKHYHPSGINLLNKDTAILNFFVHYKSFLNYRTRIKNEELIKIQEENLKLTVEQLIKEHNLTKIKHDLSSFNLDDTAKTLIMAIKNAGDIGLKEEATIIASYLEYLNSYKFYLLIKE